MSLPDIPAHLRRTISPLYHVGTLDAALRGTAGARGGISLEGTHLSVSTEPEAWRKIARLGDAPTRRLHAPEGGALLDMHRAVNDPAFMAQVRAWGLAEHLVTTQRLWRTNITDEEGETWHSLHRTLFEALIEYGDDDDDDDEITHDFSSLAEQLRRSVDAHELEQAFAALAKTRDLPITPVDALAACPSLDALGHHTGDLDATEALLVYLAQIRGLHGCWWNEHLDPARLSAPRGLLFNAHWPSWLTRAVAGQDAQMSLRTRTLRS